MRTAVVIFCINTNEYLTEEMELTKDWKQAKTFSSYEEVERYLSKNAIKIVKETGQIYFAGRKLHTLYYPANPSLSKYWFELFYQIFGLVLFGFAGYVSVHEFGWKALGLFLALIWANNIAQRKL